MFNTWVRVCVKIVLAVSAFVDVIAVTSELVFFYITGKI